VGMRTRIISSLSDALKGASISAQVVPANGSIALESDVLFEQGYSDLSPRGEQFIDRFLPVYLDVLFSDEYRPYVAEIIIEGHTDSLGTYLSNLELSQRRALAVAAYVLDDDYRGISTAQKKQLREVVTANGRSFSDLIYDAEGCEDMDASRRVVFKFRLTDEQMIQQMKSILESGDLTD
ncbi:MAG: OmpA family protein, partial [Clostridia bacterium]|nr:OmpA family protein [Clostridia bacterium]